MADKWWKKSVVYQIYPRSFCDSNNDGIGDINGITSKLQYIKQLGVDVIWLSPIYESPNDDNGYDISNYQKIMDEFGSMNDFDNMLQKAHELGLKIVMDLVVNHTSDEHEWFIKSRNNDEKYKDYYIWRKGTDNNPPTNWGSWFSGSAWEYDEHRKEYYLHCFSKKQPDLNWENEAVRKDIYKMMKFWCDKGIDGFRMDVISMISKAKIFKDGQVLQNGYGDFGPYVHSGYHVHDFLQEMNKCVLSKYDLLSVGECPMVNTEQACKYASLDGKELSMVFQFEHVELDNESGSKWTDKKIDLVDLKKVLSNWQITLFDKAWNSLFFSNHDQPRIVSRLCTDEKYHEEAAKTIATCLHFMQGTPYIYQGEEIGMTNICFNNISEVRDIESINAYNENVKNGMSTDTMLRYINLRGRDNARTPMQWSDDKYAGFSTIQPWIKVNDNYKFINVKEQINRSNSIYNHYRQLIAIRKKLDIITYGSFNLLFEEDEDLFIYERNYNDEKLIVVCNFSTNIRNIELKLMNKDFCILVNNYYDRQEESKKQEIINDKIILRAYESFVIKYN